MEIFQSEIDAGLEQQIRSNASIAYTMDIVQDTESLINLPNESEFISKAGLSDIDISRVFSILVSTTWNKNDDIFDPKEVWAARHTPLYKPTNLEHDEKQIVGSIIGNWPVDLEFNLIPEDINEDNLPDKFHILVASVIYKQWQDPEYKERTQSLLDDIKANKKKVSMECIFKGFDYAVMTADGNFHYVARSENTAFLTKYLRAYGGLGVYQDHKIGRLLRNLTFSGKGFVDNPANPESIIFNSDRDFPFSKASRIEVLSFQEKGVSNILNENPISKTKQESEMSDFLEKEVAELKSALEASKAEIKQLTDQLSSASVKEYQSQIESLKASISNLETEKASFATVTQKAEEKIASLESTISTLNTQVAEYEDKMKKMEEEKKKEKRMASLIDAGLSTEDATAQVETFANLSDDQFDVFASMMKKMSKEDKSKSTSNNDDLDASQAAQQVLDSAQASADPNLSIPSDDLQQEQDSAIANLRNKLTEWASSQVDKLKK